jgi:hypothetical protein
MGGSVEYLFAPTIGVADQAARKQGWLTHGRTQWQKSDGTLVQFIFCVEQVALVPKKATIYIVGDGLPKLAHFKRKYAKLAQ